MQALISLIFFGFVPGAILWIFISRRIYVVEALACGFVISQTLIAIGLVLSRTINVYSGRYIPLALSLLLLPHAIGKINSKTIVMSQSKKWQLIFPLLSTALLIPQALTSISVSTLKGGAFLALDTDTQFLLSMASESIHRIPSVYPHAADTQIAYTWLFSGVIGFWSNVTNIDTIRLMLFYWPIFFAIIFPLLTFIITYRITNRSLPAIVACFAVAVFGGPKLPEALYWVTASPIYLWSPHRDFATIVIVTLIISVIVFNTEERGPVFHVVGASLLFVLSFTLMGSKGSILFLLVGGGVCSLLLNFPRNKRSLFIYLRTWVPIGLGVLSSQLLVVRMTGYARLSFPSASFISSELPNRFYVVLFFFGCITILCSVPIALLRSLRNLDKNVLSLLIGIPLTVIPGILFVSHPGQSQLYFWQSAVPVLLIGLSIVLSEIIGTKTIRTVLVITIILTVNQFLNWSLPLFIFLTFELGLVLVTFALIFAQKTTRQPYPRTRRFLNAAVFCPIIFTSLMPMATPPVGAWHQAIDSTSVTKDQIESLQWVRTNTPISALFITNKHCSRGSLIQNDCSDRWFIFSALSERRFLSESRGYTWRKQVPWNNYASLSDQFTAEPSVKLLKQLQDLGVQYLYVDLQLPYSRDLNRFASLIYSNMDSQIYSLVGEESNTSKDDK